MTELDLLKYKTQFDQQGWVIVPKLLTYQDRIELKTEMIKQTLKTVFTRQGVNLDAEDVSNLKLLTDPKLRKDRLSNPKMIWRNNNSRDPIVGKSTGMINIHYNPLVLDKIAFNPVLYQVLSALYGRIQNGILQPRLELVHLYGPERFSIKSLGSTDMPKHIDANPFHSEVNYPERIQSLYCVEVDSQINPADSGTIAILENFCFYFGLLGNLCHPKTGVLPFPESRSRFFLLPNKFNSDWLLKINQLARLYTNYYHLGIRVEPCLNLGTLSSDQLESRFEELKQAGKVVPSQFREIKWKVIHLEPGDFFCWSQYTPHYSCRNKSEIPRMVCYYSIFPVQKTWYNTSHQRWLQQMFTNRAFFYSTNAGEYQTTIKNPEEYEYLQTQNSDEYLILLTDQLRGKLSGCKSWFSTE